MARKGSAAGKTHQIRRERFLRVAEYRANLAIEALRKLGQCGNSINYAYEVSEVDEMLTAVREAYNEMADEFTKPAVPQRVKFGFKKKPVPANG